MLRYGVLTIMHAGQFHSLLLHTKTEYRHYLNAGNCTLYKCHVFVLQVREFYLDIIDNLVGVNSTVQSQIDSDSSSR